MMKTEIKKSRSGKLRRAVIMGHRKRFNLCILCGKQPHEGSCIEDYSKTNTDGSIVPKEKNVNVDRKVIQIIRYRKQKVLCLRCGKDPHDGSCVEIFNKADNRTIEDKVDRPAIVEAPKFKPVTILEEVDFFSNKDIRINLQKTEDIKLFRNYIVLSIANSKKGNIIEFSFLNVLSRRFDSYIICIIGDVDKKFTYADILKLKKLTNIKKINNNDQDIVNHLCGCKKLFSFENDYTDYCKKNSIPVHIFDDGKNVTSMIRESVFFV